MEESVKKELIEVLEKISEEDFKEGAKRWLGFENPEFHIRNFISILDEYI